MLNKIVQKIPFLRLTIALSVGIILGSVFQPPVPLLFVLLLVFIGVAFFSHNRYNFQSRIYFGLTIHLIFLIAGMLVFISTNLNPIFFDSGKFSATVLEILQEKPNSYQSVLNINSVSDNDTVFNTDEKVMVWFAKTERAKKLIPGQSVFFKKAPQLVKNNNNPFEFDYKSYLSRNKIYRQVYLSENDWIINETPANFSLTVLAEKVRLKLLQIYHQQSFEENELHVLSALTLGYKRGLDPETKRVFASAGAMHVLAVSGLHVGIVFLILSILLGFLKKHQKGRYVFIVVVLIALWSFAFITGLSPSVKRAAFMFSFVVIGNNMNRQASIYNSLAASAFLLLLINPNNLFEPGFQLSYSAVFGIVFLQPKFDKILYFEDKIRRFALGLLTVSIAAQVATFPVSVYYFSQFPVYFWVTNIVVIPAAMVLIPLGIFLLAFNWIPLISSVLAFIISLFVKLLVGFLAFIENLPGSVAEFSITGLELVFILGVLFSFYLFIETGKNLFYKGILLFFLLVLTASFATKTARIFQKEMVVYNYPQQIILHLSAGKNNYVISEENHLETQITQNMIADFVQHSKLNSPVYLNANQSYSDEILKMKNGLLLFDGRYIFFRNKNRSEPGTIIPEIIVGANDVNYAKKLDTANQVFVTYSRFQNPNVTNLSHVYYLNINGAYRERW